MRVSANAKTYLNVLLVAFVIIGTGPLIHWATGWPMYVGSLLMLIALSIYVPLMAIAESQGITSSPPRYSPRRKHMMDPKHIARIAHEMNRRWCQLTGDDSIPAWRDAPDWQKESILKGVQFHLAEHRTPEQSHQSWLEHKLQEGWKYGPVKDPEKREHPCMVPYNELPASQQTKDAIFTAVVNGLSK